MNNKISALILRYKEILIYVIFGFLTTVVNYLVYLPLLNSKTVLAAVANIIAWIVAVIFAFLTNKPFVFQSGDWSIKTVAPEFIKFVGSRLSSLVIETAILFLCVDIANWDGLIMKVLTSVLVVILNYITSKYLVFKKSR